MKALSNFEIENFFNGHQKFGGVINKSDLKSLDNKLWIANLDTPEGQGTHWVLVSDINPSFVAYIDSFGLPPPEHIKNLMEKTKKHIFINTKQIQKISTSSCGQFAIRTGKGLLAGQSPIDVMADYTDNLGENEDNLKKYFEKLNI